MAGSVMEAKANVYSFVVYNIYSKITNTLDVYIKRIISYFSDNPMSGCERMRASASQTRICASESSKDFLCSYEQRASRARPFVLRASRARDVRVERSLCSTRCQPWFFLNIINIQFFFK